MRTFVSLIVAGALCGCSGGQQNGSGPDRVNDVEKQADASVTTAVPDAPGAGELIEAAKRAGIPSVEKAIRDIQRGKDAIPVLIKALHDDDHFVQLAAATALSEIGAHAVPDITRLLNDKDDDLRSWAIAILGSIGARAATAVPSLKAALDDPLPEISAVAATALTQIGGLEATHVLAASMTHPNKAVRELALSSVKSAEGDIAVPVLIVALKDREPGIRQSAACALYGRYATPEVASAVPALIAALTDSNDEVRWWAAHALGSFKEKSKSAVPALIETLKDANERVQNEAVVSLGQIGPEEGVVEALIGMLRHRDDHIRSAAAKALGKLGPAAKVAIPALESLRGGCPPFVSESAIEAIEKISREAE